MLLLIVTATIQIAIQNYKVFPAVDNDNLHCEMMVIGRGTVTCLTTSYGAAYFYWGSCWKVTIKSKNKGIIFLRVTFYLKEKRYLFYVPITVF